MTAARARAEDPALHALMRKIEREHGLALRSYKQPCLARRLAVRMRACGVDTFGAYAAVLERVPSEYAALLDALTINVTRFFRNPETFALLRERVVPEAWRPPGRVRVWSAGCASGEEAYSVALLFAEHALASGAGEAGLRRRLALDATDLDPDAVRSAERAEYPAAAVADVPPALLARWFTPGPPFRVVPALHGRVKASVHDLTRDTAPSPPYRLIVCRNVLIYFDRTTQERLFEAFADALAPGGRLLLGKVETLFGPARSRFELEEPRERLFRRL